jgi:SOS-response transcriptional repressor LexA
MVENRPSKKQRELLSFIDGFIKGNGYGPSYREIMRALDYKSVSTVAVHVNGLIKRGLLYKKDNSARTLEVIYEQNHTPETTSSDVKAHQAWLVTEVEAKLVRYEQSGDVALRDDLAVLIETLRLLGLKAEHATLRERFDSHHTK